MKPIESITLPSGAVLNRQEYCEWKADQFDEEHPKAKFTPQDVEDMLVICENEAQLTDEQEDDHDALWWELQEEVCRESESITPVIETQVVESHVPDSQEIAMLEALRTSSLENGTYVELRNVFDFGSDLKQLSVKEGATPTPIDYAKAVGMGFRMSEAGRYIVAEAITQIQAYGRFDHVIDQFASILRLEYPTVSAWTRVARRVPHEYRSLPYAVCQEIATAKLNANPEKEQEMRLVLLDRADKEGWDSGRARTESYLAAGKEPKQAKVPSPGWLVSMNGETWIQREQPGIETGMILVDLKKLEILKDDGKRVEMVPLEVR